MSVISLDLSYLILLKYGDWAKLSLMPLPTLKSNNSLTPRQGIYDLEDLLNNFIQIFCTVLSSPLLKVIHDTNDLKYWKVHQRV